MANKLCINKVEYYLVDSFELLVSQANLQRIWDFDIEIITIQMNSKRVSFN